MVKFTIDQLERAIASWREFGRKDRFNIVLLLAAEAYLEIMQQKQKEPNQ